MNTFCIHSFGCRASQADGAALESLLLQKGMQPSGQTSQASLVVLNTCTVTSAAEAGIRQTIRRIHRENPAGRIVVTGCYAQRAPEELAALPGVALVAGNSHQSQIADLVSGLRPDYHGQILVSDMSQAKEVFSAPLIEAAPDRARPIVRIQDGCGNRCSFCIIPSVRGRSRSAPADGIVEQVRRLAERYPEVVLSGINLGRWGREAGGMLRLRSLLRRLLAETPIERIRLSSIEPMDWSNELIELMASTPRIARHVHMPLQSGSATVLRRMRRRYKPHHYADRIEKAWGLLPDAAFGADVMTGFPGETDQEFEESRQFIDALPFTYLHVFTYSERPGTEAVGHSGAVPVSVRRERNRELQALGAAKHQAFQRRMIGRTLSAVSLVEPRMAMTTNYLRVEMAFPREPNRLLDLKIQSLGPTGLREAGVLPVLASAFAIA